MRSAIAAPLAAPALRVVAAARLVRNRPPRAPRALSDAIPAAVARAGEPLRCEVTPSDGVLRDPAASASATPAA
jgi:hypothetical protein